MVSRGHLEIGFPEGSFQLNSIRETSAIMELRGLATTFFRTEPAVKIVPMTKTPADAPATLLEKKSLDEAERSRIMEETAKGHPMVVAALEIFGGEIEKIKAE
jgi:DNA polymerase-3 subunit gamma/tau